MLQVAFGVATGEKTESFAKNEFVVTIQEIKK